MPGQSWGRAVSYAGPGNLVLFSIWHGLRAVDAAYAANSGPSIDLDNNAGSTVTISVKRDGRLDTATASPLIATHKVSQIYDQIGTRHAINLDHATRPLLAL